MKNKALLFLGLGALAVAGAVTASVLSAKNVAVETDAVGEPTILYFDATAISSWKVTAGSETCDPKTTMYVRYWDYTNENGGFISCANLSDYVFSFDASVMPHTNFGFAFRASDSGTEDWRETKWINYSGLTKNVFVARNSQDGSDKERYYYDSYASETASPIDFTTPLTPSYETRRVWASVTDVDWWGKPAIRGGDAENTYYYEMTAVNNGASGGAFNCYYADIPTSLTFYNFIKRLDHFNAYTHITSAMEGQASGQILYIKDNGNGTYRADGGGVADASAAFVAKVLEGFVTCSSSTVNGYGACANIKSKFIDSLADINVLEGANITDYAYHDTKETYTGADIRNKSVTAKAKWDEMYSKYTASLVSPALKVEAVNSNSSVATATTIGAVGFSSVAAAVGYFFVKRKRLF